MPHNNVPHNNMQGGMFGPMGGSQNMGGMGRMSERELAMILASMQGNSPTGTTLPNYAPAGPAQPQQVPGIGTTGLDSQMTTGAAGGGLQGMDFGAQDLAGGMQDVQDAMFRIGQNKLEEERLRQLLMATRGGGGMGGMGGMGGGIPQSAQNRDISFSSAAGMPKGQYFTGS